MRAFRLAAGVACVLASAAASAQSWQVQGGATAGLTYNDNYFFRAQDEDAAFVLNAGPSFAVTRATESTSIAARGAVSGSLVTGPPGRNNFWGGNLALDAEQRDERASYGVNVFASRSDRLQSGQTPAGVVLTRTTTDSLNAGARYGYALSERWTADVTGGVFANSFDSSNPNATLRDNRGVNFSAGLGYEIDPRTTASLTATFLASRSDLTDSDVTGLRFGASHRFSPRLAVSASVGYSWSVIRSRQQFLACPAAPILCLFGLVAPVPVAVDTERRDGGALYGGSLQYEITERTDFKASLTENILPSSAGALNRTRALSLGLSHAFSDRLTGTLGARYSQTTFPAALGQSFTNDFYEASATLVYRLAERWTLSGGYRHSRAEYEAVPGTPRANALFIVLQYGAAPLSFDPAGFGAPLAERPAFAPTGTPRGPLPRDGEDLGPAAAPLAPGRGDGFAQ